MTSRIDPELLAEIVEPQELSISPDGRQVVYEIRPSLVRSSEHIQSSLWIADLGEENSSRRLTQGDFEDHAAKFSPDGKYVSFLSDRSNPGKAAILYLLPLSGGEALPLTSKDAEMSIGAYEWRPDGKAIAFLSADEKSEPRRQQEKDGNDVKVYDEYIDYAKLRVVDIGTHEVKTFECVEDSGYQLAWNSEGTKIVYATTKTPDIDDCMQGFTLHIVNVEADSSELLCHCATLLGSLCWYHNRILWNGCYVEGSRTTGRSVCALDLSIAEKDPQVIAHGEKDCTSSIKLRNDQVLVHVLDGLTDLIETLEGKPLYQAKHKIRAWDAHVVPSQTALVLAEGCIGSPTEVFSIVDGNRIQLSNHSKEMTDKRVGKAHTYEYTHEDGTPIDGLYAVPTSLSSAFDKKQPQKTVLVVHGGPYNRITDQFDVFWHWTTFFMSLGYLVLVPNYRGGASHGHDYANAVRYDASQSYQDVVWQVKKGVEEGYIDPDRVIITGWSQGGYMSYLAVTRDDTFHFRAAIPGAGVSDWCTLAFTTDIPSFESEISGPEPWDSDPGEQTRRQCSPIYHMNNVRTPVLILHGEGDQRVPVEQGIGFYRGLKSKGKEVTLVTYPGESHCLPMPWKKVHYIDMMGRIENFLAKHMA